MFRNMHKKLTELFRKLSQGQKSSYMIRKQFVSGTNVLTKIGLGNMWLASAFLKLFHGFRILESLAYIFQVGLL